MVTRTIKINIWDSSTPLECGCCGETVAARLVWYYDEDLAKEVCRDCGESLLIAALEMHRAFDAPEGLTEGGALA